MGKNITGAKITVVVEKRGNPMKKSKLSLSALSKTSPGFIWSAAGLIFLLGVTAFSVPLAPSAEKMPEIALKPDLTIGIEDGNENLMFGSISRIDLDGKGNVYILDYKYRKIGVFDSGGKYQRTINVPAGQGPQEATNLSGIAVTPKGTIFINDMRKVIVYGPDGQFVRSFLVDFMISSIGCPGTEDLVAIGPHNEKILHIFDQTGKLLDSFGEPFPIPAGLEPMKDMPMFRAPTLFNCGKDGHIYVLNPNSYKVSIFKDQRLERTLEGKSDLFQPIRQIGRAFISTAAHIVQSGELVFVVFQNPDPKAAKKMDIFRGNKQIGTMDVAGTPHVVDSQGRIYFYEDEGFPKVVRYRVIAD
jgi:hypothetical protein